MAERPAVDDAGTQGRILAAAQTRAISDEVFARCADAYSAHLETILADVSSAIEKRARLGYRDYRLHVTDMLRDYELMGTRTRDSPLENVDIRIVQSLKNELERLGYECNLDPVILEGERHVINVHW